MTLVLPIPTPAYDRTTAIRHKQFLEAADLLNYKKGADIELAQGQSLIIRSPNGLRWAVGVSNTGAVQSPGATGQIGEYHDSTLVGASAIALTSNVSVNVTSISLGPGDWDVTARAYFTGGATTTVSQLSAAISTTSATLVNTDTPLARANFPGNGQTPFSVGSVGVPVGPARVVLSAPATVYLVSRAVFGVSTATTWGAISARRAAL